MVKELIDVKWGQAVNDNLSSIEIDDILEDICTSQITTSYCQAQPKLQVKLSLNAELALFSFDPATHPHPSPISDPGPVVSVL